MMVYTIQMLRGIAALLVVMSHIRNTLNDVYSQKDLGELLFSNGSAGVDLFFIISGFIICLSSQKNEDNNVSKFAIRRFFRIYPLFIISLVAYQIFSFPEFNVSYFVRSIFLLPRGYGGDAPFFEYNLLFPAWTLLFEVSFYAIFAVSMAITHKHRVVVCSVFILIIYIYTNLSQSGALHLSGMVKVTEEERNIFTVILYTIGSPMMILFVCGMWIHKIYTSIKDFEINKSMCIYIYFICSSIYVVCFLSGYKAGIGLSGYGAWAIILIIGCLAYEMTEPKIKKSLLFLGEISYSLYLTHVVTIGIFNSNAEIITIYPESVGVPRFILLTTASIAVSIPVYYFIERPSIKFGKMLVSRLFDKNRDTIYGSSTMQQ
ncbi:MAG: acyltransferase [Hafnia sp.]